MFENYNANFEKYVKIDPQNYFIRDPPAAYTPTLTQFEKQKLLSLHCGRLRQVRLFPNVQPKLMDVSLPLSLQRPILQTNTSAALLRKKVKQENKETWEKQGKKLRQGKPSSTDIFKRPRKRKSTEM